MLTFAARLLRRGDAASLAVPGPLHLRFPLRSAARNPGRSVLILALVAVASFLIVAMSAFAIDPASETLGKSSGNGGFPLLAESTAPNLLQPQRSQSPRGAGAGRQGLSCVPSFRLPCSARDDASCLNLFQPRQPRVVGIPDGLIDRGGFAWAGDLAQSESERANPWQLLRGGDDGDDDGADPAQPVPVVLDAATAMYSLHLYGGPGEEFTLTTDRAALRCRVVGLLKNSLFQGQILTGEARFRRLFPGVSGYRLFLVDTAGDGVRVSTALEAALSDYGLDAVRSLDRLTQLLAVQNNYLSTFQSLGGLGLILGMFGVAAAQLRGIWERRGELALLQAAGFRRRTLLTLVLEETSLLLAADC